MENLDLLGGNIALDFANSASQRQRGEPATERLVSYADLVTFGRRTDLIGPTRAGDLLADAARRPEDAAAIVTRARVLREVIYAVFAAVASSARPADNDIAVLNSFLEEGMRFRRLERDERCCGWAWSPGDEPLAQMLWPIVNAAAELLVDGELDRVKLCGNDACAWLFIDVSRNRSRRWCDMKDCGNRAKARRHYARQKEVPASDRS
ncbi:MAG: CGNR zinc finger domain-containing protein [Longimicrobiales bacterium]